ncbi:MAG: high-affinity Zn(2+) transporter zrt1 [Pycnora praestabilis]|nr:MAG: high-affinity Zn(2+) transporter zrt1 [Pycnora praestabilis]
MAHATTFDSYSLNLTAADPRDVICYLEASHNDYDGRLGARISALFVILVVSTVVTFFPVVAKRVRWLKIPLYVYLFARYFGAGVIVATAFIHLLDPAYGEIGPNTCVGMTGHWADYSWCPAIVLTAVILIFLLDFAAERYVEVKYGIHTHEDVQAAVTGQPDTRTPRSNGEIHEHSTAEQTAARHTADLEAATAYGKQMHAGEVFHEDGDSLAEERSFKQQIAAFLILEFGVVFHSVIIGLNLGVVGSEFNTLYPVLVFHQSFEGLGIGARMSAIPFPKGSWLPWILCSTYGLTTPISIAVGLGVKTTYDPGSFTANVVSGVLDSMSAGILIYTGLVELLARDFLFNPGRTTDNKRLVFMIFCVLFGTGIMALLGKWA